MIRIKRPKSAPGILSGRGATERKKQCQAFAGGQRAFKFEPAIYGASTVKQTLVKAQHRKCCFCESKVSHIAYGHVEHFRPKGGYRQRNGDKLQTPGYFWLAYEWSNLLFSCEICNSRFKKNLFPLVVPSGRARKPTDPIPTERPLFIDPASEDPAVHLGFREEYPYAVNGSRRGTATWRALGLDREELAEARRDHLKMVQVLKKVRDGKGPQSKEAGSLLKKLQNPKAQWSAMVRASIGAV
jgi:hypothetical protein